MNIVSTSPDTVIDLVREAENHVDTGARFVTRTGQESYYTYAEIAQRAKIAAAYLQQTGLQPGDRVALILPTSVNFFDAMLGVQLAGGIPVAMYPPVRFGKLSEYLERLRSMLGGIGTRFVITDSKIRKIIGSGVLGVNSIENILNADDLVKHGSESEWRPPATSSDSLAFLQFSSGSTLEPKAVCVSNRNLLENLQMMKAGIGPLSDAERAQGAVSWLPLYHDMGLVGKLYLGLYYPGTITFLGPEVFIVNPAIWLQTISRYRALISAAPNFAYSMCVKRVTDEAMEGVDLSCWRGALNGAETIDPRTLDQFARRFEKWGFSRNALTPVYGLAEAVLAVSFSNLSDSANVVDFNRDELSRSGKAVVCDDGRAIVSVGRPMPGLDVRIHDSDHHPLADEMVGNIVIKGPSVTKGFYGQESLTNEAIHEDWLDTGDLGFFRDGELFVCGRAKDVIILRGRNYAPQEFEDLLVDVDGVRLGCVAAVGMQVRDSGEELIVLAERDSRTERPDDEIAADINQRILRSLSLSAYHTEILRPGTLPRTSSGKLRRSTAAEQYLAGELVAPENVTALKLIRELSKSQISWARYKVQRHRQTRRVNNA